MRIDEFGGSQRKDSRGTLQTHPIWKGKRLELDSGLYECILNGETAGWIRIEVYALWDSILDGFINYIVVILVGSPIFFMILACQTFAKYRSSIQEDPLFIGEDPEAEENYEELMMQLKDAELYR
uniref:Ig-like domain-containing protein n=1 Tax=Bursaphelenchus xylophilus TaxID=6326 RepID=A0A1I7S8H3_BURXY